MSYMQMGKSLFRPNRSLASMKAQFVKYMDKKHANSTSSSHDPTSKPFPKQARVEVRAKQAHFGPSKVGLELGEVKKQTKPVEDTRKQAQGVGDRPEVKMDGVTRVPLSEAVSVCMKKWYKETLNEARKGDYHSQVLVSQMYYNGYGCSKSTTRGYRWFERATENKTQRGKDYVWQIRNKHPGYVRSDSESENPE